jgi:aminoglycoside phosphotransferase (APT) family kinase protein
VAEQRAPRAVGGVRMSYAELPAALTRWLTERFGAVEPVAAHIGGMSPGCAQTLALAAGERIFLKAAGPAPNPQTAGLFRYEAAILARLPASPSRPALLASYDEDGWVAIVLEQIEGRYPDLGSPGDLASVADLVLGQSAELTPAPAGVAARTLAADAGSWIERWADIEREPARYLPDWAARRAGEFAERVRALPAALPAQTLCHFDVRDDNLLIRPDGRAAIFDWGMARVGPAWADALVLALQLPDPPAVRRQIRRWVPAGAQETAEDLLIAVAGAQAWRSRQPPRPGLPTLGAFAAEEAARIVAVLRPGGSAAAARRSR